MGRKYEDWENMPRWRMDGCYVYNMEDLSLFSSHLEVDTGTMRRNYGTYPEVLFTWHWDVQELLKEACLHPLPRWD